MAEGRIGHRRSEARPQDPDHPARQRHRVSLGVMVFMGSGFAPLARPGMTEWV